MRPFQIILIAVFAVLALVGLYVFSNFAGFGSSGPQIGTVTIWGTFPQKSMDDALNLLKQGSKDYNGVSYKQMPAGTFDTDLADALASGTGPDLVIIDQEQLLTEQPKLTEIPFSSIPERTFLDTYVAIDEEYLTQTGTYGIPLTVDPLVLYYNRSILSAAGVATPPTTWEMVTGLAPTITKQSGSQAISVSTIPFGGYANVTNARAILSLLLLQAGSPITALGVNGIHAVMSDTSQVSGTTGNAPAAAAVNFYTQFADPGRTVYSWNPSLPNSRSAFLAGDLAFYPGFASEAQGLRDANPNLNFDLAPIPQPSGTGRMTYGLAYAFAIPKVSGNKSGAYSTALALTGSSILPTLATELGQAPATRSMLTAKPDDANAAVYYPEALTAKGWLSPAPGTVDGIFSGMITNIITGRQDVQSALSNADQSLNAAL